MRRCEGEREANRQAMRRVAVIISVCSCPFRLSIRRPSGVEALGHPPWHGVRRACLPAPFIPPVPFAL